MSDEDRTAHIQACGSDVAAYALGALDPGELDAFRRHLDACSVCRDELAAFRGVVDALPVSAPSRQAPPALRRRVLRAVDAEPAPAAGSQRAARPRPRHSRWGMARPALVVALALAIAAFVVVNLDSAAAPGARVIQAQVSGQGTAELRIAHDRGQLVVRHLSPPPAGQIYQVWLQRAHASPSPTTALFSVTASGDGRADVPGSLRGVSLVMVTSEPAGGSKVPTHPAVISVPLT